VIARGTHQVEPRPAIEAADPQAAPANVSNEYGDDSALHAVLLSNFGKAELWDLDRPHLYTVNVRLLRAGKPVDEDSCRIGFREAVFTDRGFSLNGRIVKLRGLDRHQTFPFVGQAMPARVQRQDAKILCNGLHCNIVRASHYPQSRHFLDCCDEIGLLVLEEIPGWQHIGPEAWKLLAIDNVGPYGAALQFRVEMPDNDLILLGDAQGIKRLLSILLENASKYTPPGGWVMLRATATRESAEISVHDSGIGIDPEYKDRIFDRFFRVATGGPYSAGSGLGLSVAKWIAECHGTRLCVESAHGHGSCFSFSLKISNTALPAIR
jgi:hypothetical protein